MDTLRRAFKRHRLALSLSLLVLMVFYTGLAVLVPRTTIALGIGLVFIVLLFAVVVQVFTAPRRTR